MEEALKNEFKTHKTVSAVAIPIGLPQNLKVSPYC